MTDYLIKQPPANLETESHCQVFLDVIRERLQTDPDVFFAGELINPEDDGDRFDRHDFFIAPRTPLFDPMQLTAFFQKTIAGFNMTSKMPAKLYENGEMQLPDGFIDQHIGDRVSSTTTTTVIKLGSFKGHREVKPKEEKFTERLMQRTMIKVFTDPLFANLLFDYCNSLVKKELDEQASTNMFAVYASHVVPPEYLAKLKEYYQNPENNLPQLRQSE